MKKVFALCFTVLISAFMLSACIVINNNGKEDSTAAATTAETTDAAAGNETASENTQATAAGTANATAVVSTTKTAATTAKPSTAANTTNPTTSATTAPAGGCVGWPVNNITKLVPKPSFGTVFSSDQDGKQATVIIKNCTENNNKDYVKALKAAGFNDVREDYYTSFKAYNADGVMVEYVPFPFDSPGVFNKTFSTLIITSK